MRSQATRSLHPSTRILPRSDNPVGRVEGAGGPGTSDKNE